MRERLEYRCSGCGRDVSIVVHQPAGAKWVPVLECGDGCEGVMLEHRITRQLNHWEPNRPGEVEYGTPTYLGTPTHLGRGPHPVHIDPAGRPDPGPVEGTGAGAVAQPPWDALVPPPNQVPDEGPAEVGPVGGDTPGETRVDGDRNEVNRMGVDLGYEILARATAHQEAERRLAEDPERAVGTGAPGTIELIRQGEPYQRFNVQVEDWQGMYGEAVVERLPEDTQPAEGGTEDLTVETLRDAAERFVNGIGRVPTPIGANEGGEDNG